MPPRVSARFKCRREVGREGASWQWRGCVEGTAAAEAGAVVRKYATWRRRRDVAWASLTLQASSSGTRARLLRTFERHAEVARAVRLNTSTSDHTISALERAIHRPVTLIAGPGDPF